MRDTILSSLQFFQISPSDQRGMCEKSRGVREGEKERKRERERERELFDVKGLSAGECVK